MNGPEFADPALCGLEDREPGSPCDGSRHDEGYCQQIALGRDVSEYRPDIRLRHEADLHAAQMMQEPRLISKLLRRADDGSLR